VSGRDPGRLRCSGCSNADAACARMGSEEDNPQRRVEEERGTGAEMRRERRGAA